MAKGAFLFGINNYENVGRLYGCENDASELEKILGTNHDGSPNFSCKTFLSSSTRITRSELRGLSNELFTKEGLDIALFYFAGHGALTDSGSYLVTQDGNFDDEGMPMSEIVAKANASPAREKIIIIDCCHAGAIDKFFRNAGSISLERGVSILAASRDKETAAEVNRRGLFTSKICDALAGGAADVTGSVNVASTYAYLDEVLAVWDQRPLFKANVEKLATIREAEPAVSKDKLRKLVQYFPTADHVFALDPSFEPTAEPNDPTSEAIFADLQRYRGARLLVPNGEEHLYYAAMNSKSCSLTPLGQFYWHRVKQGKL